MSASGRTPVGDPPTDPKADPTRDSDSVLPRTYGRTHRDELVTLSDTGCESDARTPQNHTLGPGGGTFSPIELGRSLRFAESHGAKVIVDTDLPESVLQALAALVDAVQTEFGAAYAERLALEATQPKPMCRWHMGQLADHCGPCRSEQIGADRD